MKAVILAQQSIKLLAYFKRGGQAWLHGTVGSLSVLVSLGIPRHGMRPRGLTRIISARWQRAGWQSLHMQSQIENVRQTLPCPNIGAKASDAAPSHDARRHALPRAYARRDGAL